MDTITRKRKEGEVTYVIWTRDEADKREMTYVPWREARGGDWALTDDDYVLRCVSRKEHFSKKRKSPSILLDFGVGSVWLSKKAHFSFEERRALRAFGSSTKNWVERELGKTRTKRMIKLYVKMILAGRINYEILGKSYRDDQLKPDVTARRMLKQKEVQEVVESELNKVLADNGIDVKYTLEVLKRAVDMAEKDKQPGTMIKAVMILARMQGIEQPKRGGGFLGSGDDEENMGQLLDQVNREVLDGGSVSDR